MTAAFDVGPVGPKPAGVGVYSLSLATALVEAGYEPEVRLIGRQPDADARLSAMAAVERSRGPYLSWLERHAMRDAEGIGANLVHFSDGVVPFIRHLPVVLSVHDLSILTMRTMHPKKRWARIPLVWLSPRLATAVIVPSRATADELMRVVGVSARRVVISPYAPQQNLHIATREEVQIAAQSYSLHPDGYIIALGTIEPRKNHVRLIKAFEETVKRNLLPDDSQLVIAGRLGWGYESVQAAIAESPVRSRIVVLGFVQDGDLSAVVTGARVAAYVSLYEGFGLPVVETMACGVPTVTSNLSSMPEVAGEAGFLVDPFDPSSIATGLVRSWEAAQDRAAIARVSQAQAARFSWKRAAMEVAEVYQRILKDSRL